MNMRQLDEFPVRYVYLKWHFLLDLSRAYGCSHYLATWTIGTQDGRKWLMVPWWSLERLLNIGVVGPLPYKPFLMNKNGGRIRPILSTYLGPILGWSTIGAATRDILGQGGFATVCPGLAGRWRGVTPRVCDVNDVFLGSLVFRCLENRGQCPFPVEWGIMHVWYIIYIRIL